MRVQGNKYDLFGTDGPAAGVWSRTLKTVAVNNVALTEGFETIRQTLQPGEPVQITAGRGLPKTFTGANHQTLDHALLW